MDCAKVERIRQEAVEAGQGQVFQFWDQLNETERQTLISDLEKIDFKRINDYYQRVASHLGDSGMHSDEDIEALSEEITSRSPVPMRANQNPEKIWSTIGYKEIALGRVAVILLAGGQGTRLGSSLPKGMYDVGLPSHKSLFQIQAERLRRVTEMANKRHNSNGVIPFYIMTSAPTHDSTVKYFESHGYFGLDPANVIFFKQNTLPCLTMEGKIILDKKFKVAEAPDGNGGIYRAMLGAGVIDDMHRRNIVHIHAYCVDNILVKVADPVFIGFCSLRKADSGAKVVIKEDPHESVGVLCQCRGKYKIVEYSEISKESAERRKSDGTLALDGANIANHYFSMDFLDDVCNKHFETLSHHIAKKKIPSVNDQGELIKVDGMKLELFIFDIFQFSERLAVHYGKREEEFSPLKNASGASSCTPQHCCQDLLSKQKKWIEAEGGKFDSPEAYVEVSPLLSYGGEDLTELVNGKVFSGVSVLTN